MLRETGTLRLRDDVLQDRRRVEGITIDGPTTKDIDDAIFLERTEKGYRITVSIADVTSLVSKDSYVDTEALSRLLTRYHRNHTVPMLPRKLSEDALSLVPRQDRPAISVTVELGPDLAIVATNIEETVLHSTKQFNYYEADRAIGDEQHAHHALLSDCDHLARRLLAKRRERGALALYDFRKMLMTTEEGQLQPIKKSQAYRANVVVQEFMVLANEAVARFCAEHDVPLLYRNQQANTVAPQRTIIVEQIDNILRHPEGFNLQTEQAKLTMWFRRAEYGPNVEGHYALNVPAYTHFTSPLRRYPDIVDHRIIKAHLREEAPPYNLEELTAIAQYINAGVRGIIDAREEQYKERDRNTMRSVLVQDTIRKLPEAEFQRALERAAKEGLWSTAFEEEVLSRFDTLRPVDLYYILLVAPTTEQWAALKQHVRNALARRPHDAIQVLTLAGQSGREWRLPEFEVQDLAGSFAARTIVEIERKLLSTATFAVAGTKKDAKSLAAHSFVTGYLDNTLVPPEQTRMPKELQVQHITKSAAPPEENVIGQLHELCQARKWPAPVLDASNAGGPSHAPTFTGTAKISIGGKEYASGNCSAATKHDAKKLAAQELLRVLRTLPPPQQQEDPATRSTTAASSEVLQENAIGKLHELCQKRRWKNPWIDAEQTGGQANIPVFTGLAIVTIGGTEYSSDECNGGTKQDAKQLAAQNLLHKLKEWKL